MSTLEILLYTTRLDKRRNQNLFSDGIFCPRNSGVGKVGQCSLAERGGLAYMCPMQREPLAAILLQTRFRA